VKTWQNIGNKKETIHYVKEKGHKVLRSNPPRYSFIETLCGRRYQFHTWIYPEGQQPVTCKHCIRIERAGRARNFNRKSTKAA